MKRVLIAVVAVSFVVAAITVARAHSGARIVSAPEDSRSRDLIAQQAEEQSDEVLKAQSDLAKRVADEANDGLRSHTFAVTIREVHPGAVWVVEKVDGKPACATPHKDTPTKIEVSIDGMTDSLTSKAAPLVATLLKSGACEASLDLFVPWMADSMYKVAVTGPGHGTFDPVRVRAHGEPQKVTVVGR